MIRLRDIRGKVIPLPPDAMFVEICDTAGNPSAVLITSADGTHQLIQDGEEVMERYRRMFHLKTSRFIDLPTA